MLSFASAGLLPDRSAKSPSVVFTGGEYAPAVNVVTQEVLPDDIPPALPHASQGRYDERPYHYDAAAEEDIRNTLLSMKQSSDKAASSRTRAKIREIIDVPVVQEDNSVYALQETENNKQPVSPDQTERHNKGNIRDRDNGVAVSSPCSKLKTFPPEYAADIMSRLKTHGVDSAVSLLSELSESYELSDSVRNSLLSLLLKAADAVSLGSSIGQRLTGADAENSQANRNYASAKGEFDRLRGRAEREFAYPEEKARVQPYTEPAVENFNKEQKFSAGALSPETEGEVYSGRKSSVSEVPEIPEDFSIRTAKAELKTSLQNESELFKGFDFMSVLHKHKCIRYNETCDIVAQLLDYLIDTSAGMDSYRNSADKAAVRKSDTSDKLSKAADAGVERVRAGETPAALLNVDPTQNKELHARTAESADQVAASSVTESVASPDTVQSVSPSAGASFLALRGTKSGRFGIDADDIFGGAAPKSRSFASEIQQRASGNEHVDLISNESDNSVGSAGIKVSSPDADPISNASITVSLSSDEQGGGSATSGFMPAAEKYYEQNNADRPFITGSLNTADRCTVPLSGNEENPFAGGLSGRESSLTLHEPAAVTETQAEVPQSSLDALDMMDRIFKEQEQSGEGYVEMPWHAAFAAETSKQDFNRKAAGSYQYEFVSSAAVPVLFRGMLDPFSGEETDAAALREDAVAVKNFLAEKERRRQALLLKTASVRPSDDYLRLLYAFNEKALSSLTHESVYSAGSSFSSSSADSVADNSAVAQAAFNTEDEKAAQGSSDSAAPVNSGNFTTFNCNPVDSVSFNKEPDHSGKNFAEEAEDNSDFSSSYIAETDSDSDRLSSYDDDYAYIADYDDGADYGSDPDEGTVFDATDPDDPDEDSYADFSDRNLNLDAVDESLSSHNRVFSDDLSMLPALRKKPDQVPEKRLMNHSDFLELLSETDPWYALINKAFPDRSLFYSMLVGSERIIDPADPSHWTIVIDKNNTLTADGGEYKLNDEIRERLEKATGSSLKITTVHRDGLSAGSPMAMAAELEKQTKFNACEDLCAMESVRNLLQTVVRENIVPEMISLYVKNDLPVPVEQ